MSLILTEQDDNLSVTFSSNAVVSPNVIWGDITGDMDDQEDLQAALDLKANQSTTYTKVETDAAISNHHDSSKADASALTSHTSNQSNPHNVTKSQVGLGNVNNTSDANKPISNATQIALNGKQATLVSGTNIKTINDQSILGSGNIVIQGGGGNVDDVEQNGISVVDENKIAHITVPTKTSDITNDSGFITNSYHDETKQDVISDLLTIRGGASLGATSIQPLDNVSELTNDVGYLTQHQSLSNYYTKTQTDSAISDHHDSTKADASVLTSHTSNTSNPHSVTKAQVGLGNVLNTAISVNGSGAEEGNLTHLSINDGSGNLKYTVPQGTVTSIGIKMNGASKGTINDSGIIDLGTVITSHQSLSAYRTSSSQDAIDTGLSNRITTNSNDIDTIEAKIPTEATSSNQLADKAFVNSSIATNTAYFRGTSASGLTEQQFIAWANTLTKTNNDYVFWNTTDTDGNVVFKRYKYNGTQWLYEYSLNNSSFTQLQWSTINSGLTSSDKTTIDNLGTTYATKSELTSGLSGKQDSISFSYGGETEINEINGSVIGAKYDFNGNSIHNTYATKNELSSGLGSKQNTLSTAQLNACNSGITSSKVSTYDGYASTISGKESSSNKVTSISSSSTDSQYPSAKCVYDIVGNIESLLEALR